MECGQCGTGNRDGARFCRGCGQALARRCASCGAELIPDSQFCDGCGSPVDATAASVAPVAAPRAVRKTVTVLFADLGGSTGFGERTDAEVSRQVLAQYHAMLQAVIDAHGGTVAKFMGDGMMATFGIPEVAEDDARRAIAAGAVMQQRFHEFAAEIDRRYGETLTLRVGINTGEVVIGEGDADLIGDALNVAARLEKACRPGHVLVGEETWRLTRGEVGYEELGEVTVAGRAQPVAIYELATETGATPDVATPFVGRDAEMQRLVGVFDDARRGTNARLVTVLGSPGVGKTRLSRELCSHLAEAADAQRVEIRCDRAGEATFAPVAQLIRDAAGLGEDTDGDAARVAIGTLLPAGEADHARVVDVLAALVGAAPGRSVEETFWGVRRLIEATAAVRPLVVVVDDIQWAEPLLLDLIEHLAEWVANAAVLIVGLARPELREVRPSLAEPGRPVAAVVVLDGLDASATEALAAGLLGTDRLPAGLVERLPSSTDGNPLFVRELVRMLVDDRVIRQRDDGEWELTIDAEAVDVPPTIQSLLGARVERLPAAERELLEQAAVVGAEFSLGALRELAGAGTPIVPMLEAMRRKELVEPTGTYWGDEPVYRFHHVLIRDAAYRRLLKTTRAELHERVAAWTDRTAADLIGEHETAIAFHYEQAFRYRGELGARDDHGAELGRRAAELLATAAQRALDRDDLAAAGASSARALALLPESDAAARADLLMMGCECLLATGDGTAAAPLVEELVRTAAADPRLAAWGECYTAQLVGLTDPDGLVTADAQARAAAEALTALDDGSGQAKAHQVRAGLLARLGRVGDAELELDLALAAARAADDRRRVTAVLGAAPDAALFGPSPVARAGGRCLDVVRLLRITTASPAVEAASNRCQAVLEALRGRFDVSRSMLASARASLEELGLRHGLAQTELYAGMVELIAGNPHGAIAPLRAAYQGLGTLGVGADAGQAAALLATALLAEGDVDEAELMAAESEALAGQNLKTAVGWRVARAEVLAARGDLTAAVTLAEEAVRIAAGTDLVIDHADACVALAGIRARAGDVVGARSSQADAKRLYEQKGATVPAERLDVAGDGVAEPAPSPAPSQPAAIAHASSVENAASRVDVRVAAMLFSGSDRELADLIAPEFVFEDRRHVVNFGVSDFETSASHLEWGRHEGQVLAPPTPVAVRGERLVLSRRSARKTPTGDDLSSFAVVEIDAQGRMLALVQFDEADLDAAVEELDARYVAGEGVQHAAEITLVSAWMRALGRLDFDEIRRLSAPSLVYADHRPLVGWGTVGLDEMIELFRSLADLPWGLLVSDLRVADRCSMVTAENRAIDANGGEVVWPFHVVGVSDDSGRASRVEVFDGNDWDAALARFDELRARRGDPRTPEIVNASSRAVDRVWKAALEQRYDEVAAMLAPDLVRIDHRSGGVAAATFTGGEAYLELVRASSRPDEAQHVEVVPLAVRGERLSLCRCRVEVLDFEIPVLMVTELDDAGRVAAVAVFDEEALAAAVDDLDDRFLAGEGAPDARTLSAGRSAWVAMREEDLDALGRLLSPELVTVDHQRIGFGKGDRDDVLDRARSDPEVMRRHREYARKGFVSGAVVLVVYESQRLDRYGNEVLYQSSVVMRIDAADRIDRMEWFDLEDWDAALARFDHLAVEAQAAGATVLDNSAMRYLAAAREFSSNPDRDVDNFAAHWLAEDVRRVDHRTGVAAPEVSGRDAYADVFRAMRAAFVDFTLDPVAIRGDRLALVATVGTSPEGFELPYLILVEVDEAGRARFLAHFDEDDLAGGIEQLDSRYIASGEASEAEKEVLAGAAMLNRRDYQTFTARLSPDFVSIDHSPLGFPAADRDTFVRDHMAGLDAMVPDNVRIVVKLFATGDTVLLVNRVVGTTTEGNEYEWAPIFVVHRGTDGLTDRIEAFAPEDWAAARARFDTMTAGVDGVAAAAPALENLAARRGLEMGALTNAGDGDGLAALLAPDFEAVDRRSVTFGPTTSGEEFLAGAAELVTVFDEMVRDEVVAIRGERLSLDRSRFVNASGFDVPVLGLCETDGDGRILATVLFDEDGLVGAMQELEDRYRVGEGAGEAYVLGRSGDFARAYAAHDWVAVSALFADDAIVTDHRAIGQGWSTRDDFVASSRAVVDLVPDVVHVARELEARNSVVLANSEAFGTTQDGNRSAWPYRMVAAYVGGRITRFELFDAAAAARARARFEELAATDPRTPAVDNECVQLITRVLWTGRFDPDRTNEMFSPEVEITDLRSVIARPSLVGVEGMATVWEPMFAVYDAVEVVPVAVRGDRLACFDARMATERGAESGMHLLAELDDQGRLSTLVAFDEADRARAFEELERRHAELSGDAITRTEALAAAGEHTLNHRDFDAFAALLAPDFTIEDHQRFGVAMTKESYLESLRVLIDQAPDFTFVFAKLIVVGDCALAVVPFWGTTPEGSRYEWSYVQVAKVDAAGRALRFEFFPDDRWADAVACFERLVTETGRSGAVTTDTASRPIENAAIRAAHAMVTALTDRDLDSARALVREEYRYLDHRFAGIVPEASGFEGFLAQMHGHQSVGFRELGRRVVAVRGDRLALSEQTLESPEGFVTVVLLLAEIDGSGRFRHTDVYEEGDLFVALDTLDDRFIAGEGAEHEGLIRWWRDFGRAYRERDWAGLEDRFAPDAVVVDHRSIGQGWTSRADFLTATRAVVQSVPDVRHVPRRLEIRGQVTLTDGEAFGTTADGSRYSWGYHLLTRSAGGRITRLEIFDAEEGAAARARFDELAGETAEPDPENAAARWIVDVSPLLWTDLDAALDRFSPDAIGVARESGPSLGLSAGNREMWRDVLGSLAETYDDVRYETLAVRGDRLALLRQEFVTDGYVTPALLLVETDQHDQALRLETFGEEDLLRALAELELRYARSGDLTRGERQVLLAFAGLNRRQWSELDAVLAPDVAIADHRRLGFPSAIGKEHLVGALQALVVQVPDVVAIVQAVEVAGSAVLAMVDQAGTSADGVKADWAWLFVVAIGDDGKLARIEYFDADDGSAARARFDELATANVDG